MWHRYDEIEIKLLNSINEFTKIKNIYKNIPECQTNFVYSKEKPKSIKEILGISGRIVKAGKDTIVAGRFIIRRFKTCCDCIVNSE